MQTIELRFLFQEMKQLAVYSGRIGLWTDFLYLAESDFLAFKKYFVPDKYQPNKWRCGGLFKNLHAVPGGNGMIQVHVDYGNPNVSLIFGGIVHGLVDCPTWIALCLFRAGRIIGTPTMEQMRFVLREENLG